MNSIKGELKIIGINLILISSAMVAVYSLLALLAGNLLNLSCIGFEVIFPFFTAIAVCEWGKTRTDDNFDIIAAQGKSLFSWVLARSAAAFIVVSLFAVISMVIVFLVRNEMPLWEIVLTYLAPAFFLSTLGVLLNLCLAGEHISTMICGVIWLIMMLVRALIGIPLIKYVYLFIRYVGDPGGIWLINKLVLVIISLMLWSIVYLICKRRCSQFS